MQPLVDNLEAQAYGTFEKDTVKYLQIYFFVVKSDLVDHYKNWNKMLAGVKIIPREEIDQDQVEDRKKSGSNRVKKGGKQKNSKYSSSDDDLDRVKKRSGKKKKKWYSSDESSSSNSSDSESRDKRSMKRSRSRKKHNSSEGDASTNSESDTISAKKNRHRRRSKKNQHSKSKEDIDDECRKSQRNVERKSMGLEWMLRPDNDGKKSAISDDQMPEEPQIEEVKKVNPRELNPYYKENGSGFPEEEDGIKTGVDKLVPSSVVGDGGASWRLKALKRAQEQAAREGRKLEEVAGERWGSLGELAVSVSSGTAAPFRAHLHAINHRKRGQTDDDKIDPENQNERVKEKGIGRDYLKNVSLRHPDMKAPKARALSWGKRGDQSTHKKDSELVSAVVSSLNKFENDGSFLRGFNNDQKSIPDKSQTSASPQQDNYVDSKLDSSENKQCEVKATVELLSANQLTAKVMKLRMKGKHQEADELLKEAENIKANQIVESDSIRPRNDRGKSSILMPNMLVQRKGDDDDADTHLAQKIVQNKKFSISGRADEEYDYDEGPRRKTQKKGGNSENSNLVEKNSIANRIMTQQERCQFCFENPKRPKHLTVSIANFTYLMLPQWQPVVPGHCCILPLQHELATRTVDNNVWDEIRNFKKCLIMMFAKQEKDVVFLETVMELTKQQRHCMIECIPLPQAIAKQAPLYFKKAIDEAEDEWSQHNAKRLIDTTEKGLRGSVPKGFPYFHVEFGLNKGFVHVIEDEQKFKSSFGLNVIRGMMKLPEEDMYRRRRHESVEAQNKAVTSFALEWAPFDWTKQL